MFTTMQELEGYIIFGTDGEVGAVTEIYFDDRIWKVRYIVADTGSWLETNKVLLSPESVIRIDNDKKQIHFNLSKDTIKNSPSIDTDKPVSRQHESDLVAYYGWPTYWMGHGLEPMPSYMPVIPIPPPEIIQDIENRKKTEPEGDPNLRSSAEVIGYDIHAKDGDIGHVEDFVIDDANWNIRYMVVDTTNLLPGKKALVALSWIQSIDWAESAVHVILSKDAIKDSPEYNPDSPLTKEFEESLHRHYDQKMFW